MLYVGAVSLVADLKVSARGVIKVFAGRVDPGHACVHRDWRIWLVQVPVDVGITRHRYRSRAIGEVVDVLRADDVDER